VINWDEYNEICKLRDSGHHDEALERFEHLDPADDEERSAVLLGESICYRDQGSHSEMLAAVTKALKLLTSDSPSRPYAEFGLAVSYELNSKFEQAAAGFRAFLHDHEELLNTDDNVSLKLDAQHHLAAVLIMLKQYHEALFLLDAVEPELSGSELAEVHIHKAAANQSLGNNQLALQLFRQALAGSLSVHVARAHFHIGEILYQRGELQEALAEFCCAIERCEKGSPDLTAYENWRDAAQKYQQRQGREPVM
jgi:tetratricopeptide (TPR) repeat protein